MFHKWVPRCVCVGPLRVFWIDSVLRNSSLFTNFAVHTKISEVFQLLSSSTSNFGHGNSLPVATPTHCTFKSSSATAVSVAPVRLHCFMNPSTIVVHKCSFATLVMSSRCSSIPAVLACPSSPTTKTFPTIPTVPTVPTSQTFPTPPHDTPSVTMLSIFPILPAFIPSMGKALVVRDDSRCPSDLPCRTLFPFSSTSKYLRFHRRETGVSHISVCLSNAITIVQLSLSCSSFHSCPVLSSQLGAVLKCCCQHSWEHVSPNVFKLLTSGGGFPTSNHVFHSVKKLLQHVHESFRTCLLYTRNYHCFLA